MSANADWLVKMTPVLEGFRAEEDTFRRYCEQRDMGFSAESLARFFAPYWAGDFEARFQGERRLG